MKQKPVVIDLEPKKEKKKKLSPADAPPVPELDIVAAPPAAMEAVARLAARKPSRITRLFLWSVITLLGFVVSVAFWDFVTDLMMRNIWVGRAAFVLIGFVVLCLLMFAFRELAAFARLKRMDGLRAASLEVSDLKQARGFSDRLKQLYKGRRDLRWAFTNLADRSSDVLDPDAYMALVETTVIEPLDAIAMKEIEAASRQVATATAIIPLALADVVVALTANVRMIRHIAEIYGGRSGTFGSWRLMKTVAGHLVATGAVAIGDDMISSIAGGSVLSKLSRRFGEGVINGALTARVGVAAMDVCRPMTFKNVKRPSVAAMMKNALIGFASRSS
ncbi:YcjF family protein [Amylibacter sp. SFDW26]|uniref:YcjF family protein n=1 Tax=Amylibacter sp. SFDW26 TaxID=2652722 RepID=UPI00126182C9|nr:TIGR01620 family protein [Amylibacter sp. SFDW26]KAB7610484.1 YcjF family protein [Amylibacter sp. SFDW26]